MQPSASWPRALIDLSRLGAMLIFIALGLSVVWHRKRRRGQERATILFVSYAVAISLITGFTQIESWPFTTWALVHHASPARFDVWRLYGVDASGREYPIDPRFIEPLPYEDFSTWLRHFLFRDRGPSAKLAEIDPRDITPRVRPVGKFLLGRAEEARVRFLKTGHLSTNDAILGPFTAPYHFVRPRVWKGAGDVPAGPFVRLRIWDESWIVEERARDASKVDRRLIFDSSS